jgi:YVTN family beta-propeller protein
MAQPKSSHRNLLLVANQGEHTLWAIDPGSGQRVASVSVGVNDHEVAASPDGRFAYVPIYGNSGVGKPGTDGRTIDVVDLNTFQVARTIDLGRGVRPHRAVFGRDGLLYVTAELAKAVEVIDPKDDKVIGSIPTGAPESHMLALSSDGKRGYTANVGAGSVSVLDIAARKLITVIPVASQVQRIALSRDGEWAFTSDQQQPRLAVIDTATNRLSRWVPLPAVSFSTAPTLDGRWLLVALPSTKQVAVLDLGSMKVVTSVGVPDFPSEILVRPDGRVAYVSCLTAGQIAVLDLKTWKVQKLLTGGKGSDGMAWVGK